MIKKSNNNNNTTETVNKIAPQRKTTMPVINGPADPNRTAMGPKIDALLQILELVYQVSRDDLKLIGMVAAEQLKSDTAMWFEGATTYIERVATVEKYCAEEFKDFPYRGTDLLYRKERVQTLALIVDQAIKFTLDALMSLRVERADLIRMCDAFMQYVELTIKLPTTSDARRQRLDDVANAPLQVWLKRLAQVQQNKDANLRKKDELELLGEQLAAALGQSVDAGTQPPMPHAPAKIPVRIPVKPAKPVTAGRPGVKRAPGRKPGLP